MQGLCEVDRIDEEAKTPVWVELFKKCAGSKRIAVGGKNSKKTREAKQCE